MKGMFRPLRQGQLIFDIAAPSALFLICLFPFLLVGLGWVGVLLGSVSRSSSVACRPGSALGIALGIAILQMATQQSPNPANLAILARSSTRRPPTGPR